ncbi:CD5 antigen-like [Genypterus blacodes]|uniref:CD5 antigen-like n=1 Tax=Genypterus blacodes TaxID=154954 RepID=UPI003F765E5D
MGDILTLLVLLLLLWSSGLQSEDTLHSTGLRVRLVGEESDCRGLLEMKHQWYWRPVEALDWTLRSAAVICRLLGCGSAISTKLQSSSSMSLVWRISPSGLQTWSALMENVSGNNKYSKSRLLITCSDSFRLEDGPTLCSGRLKMESEQSWLSVCKDGFDLQAAQWICIEAGCRAPLLLRGTPAENVTTIRSEALEPTSCSSGETVELTCSGRSHSSDLDSFTLSSP